MASLGGDTQIWL